jgi:hypothetical protein
MITVTVSAPGMKPVTMTLEPDDQSGPANARRSKTAAERQKEYRERKKKKALRSVITDVTPKVMGGAGVGVFGSQVWAIEMLENKAEKKKQGKSETETTTSCAQADVAPVITQRNATPKEPPMQQMTKAQLHLAIKQEWPKTGSNVKPSQTQVHRAATDLCHLNAWTYNQAGEWLIRRVKTYAISRWLTTTPLAFRPDWKAWVDNYSGLAPQPPDEWIGANERGNVKPTPGRGDQWGGDAAKRAMEVKP